MNVCAAGAFQSTGLQPFQQLHLYEWWVCTLRTQMELRALSLCAHMWSCTCEHACTLPPQRSSEQAVALSAASQGLGAAVPEGLQ